MVHQRSSHPEKVDKLLSLLADRHRRIILSYFCESSTEIASVSDLVREIRKHDARGAKELTYSLHHSTLPRLADYGVVDYDARSRTVRYRGSPELETLVDRVTDLERLAAAGGDVFE